MDTASSPARDPRHRSFRIAVIVISVVAATVGSLLLATRDSGEKETTRGVAATLPVPGHPGSLTAGPDALWVALIGDPRRPVDDRPLVRLEPATGDVKQTVYLGGQASHLSHVGDRLIASVQHVGSDGFGPTRLAVLDWRSGRVLFRRAFSGPVDQVVARGNALWALEVRPGRLWRLDPRTLAPTSAPLRLSPGRSLGLASGGRYLWVTAAEAGEVIRIAPANGAIARVHVGGFPLGVVATAGGIWVADRARGQVIRLDPRNLRSIGAPIDVGRKPSGLAVAGDSLFVTGEEDATVARIDVHSGKRIGLPIRIAPPAKGAAAAPAPAVAAVGPSVWVSSFASNTLTRINPTVTASSVRRPVLPSGGESAATAAARALPRGGRVVAKIAVPSGGGGLAVGAGAVWAMSDKDGILARIDPRQDSVVARIRVGAGGEAAAGAGAVWVSHPFRSSVSRVDPRTNKVTATIRVGSQPDGIVVSAGAVWVASRSDPSVSRIDPKTNKVVATISVGPARACCAEHMQVTAGAGAVWVAVPNLNAVARVDPKTNAVTETIKLRQPPCGLLAADGTAVWASGGGCADVVARINRRTNKAAGTVDDEPHPVGLALASGSVWVAVLGLSAIDRLDPLTGRIVARLPIGAAPVYVGAGFGAIWAYDVSGRVLRIAPER